MTANDFALFHTHRGLEVYVISLPCEAIDVIEVIGCGPAPLSLSPFLSLYLSRLRSRGSHTGVNGACLRHLYHQLKNLHTPRRLRTRAAMYNSRPYVKVWNIAVTVYFGKRKQRSDSAGISRDVKLTNSNSSRDTSERRVHSVEPRSAERIKLTGKIFEKNLAVVPKDSYELASKDFYSTLLLVLKCWI